MLNSKGHRIGTAELECAMVSVCVCVCVCVRACVRTLMSEYISGWKGMVWYVYTIKNDTSRMQNHEPRLAETAVVGYPHEIYGEGKKFVLSESAWIHYGFLLCRCDSLLDLERWSSC